MKLMEPSASRALRRAGTGHGPVQNQAAHETISRRGAELAEHRLSHSLASCRARVEPRVRFGKAGRYQRSGKVSICGVTLPFRHYNWRCNLALGCKARSLSTAGKERRQCRRSRTRRLACRPVARTAGESSGANGIHTKIVHTILWVAFTTYVPRAIMHQVQMCATTAVLLRATSYAPLPTSFRWLRGISHGVHGVAVV